MPSGSHGGSRGGSHSGGGGSRGGFGGGFGGSFGGGHHSSGPRLPRGPRYFYFGSHHYVISPGRQRAINALSVFAVFAFILILISSFMLSACKENLSIIREDYEYYQNIVTYADSHSDYVKTGNVTDRFYNEDAGKYYLTYSLTTENGQTLNGYTYSVYTREEAFAFVLNSEIDIAVNYIPVNLNTDSIPMDYKDMSIERDGEYVNATKSQRNNTIFVIVSVLAFVALIGGIIALAFAKKKQEEMKAAEAIAEKKAEKEEQNPHCVYCGAKVSPKDSKCPTCGANIK